MSVRLKVLHDAAVEFKLLGIWAESLDGTIDTNKTKLRMRQAYATYILLMQNHIDYDDDYRRWAIKTALGLRASKRYTAQPTGRKNWQAWGASPLEDD